MMEIVEPNLLCDADFYLLIKATEKWLFLNI